MVSREQLRESRMRKRIGTGGDIRDNSQTAKAWQLPRDISQRGISQRGSYREEGKTSQLGGGYQEASSSRNDGRRGSPSHDMPWSGHRGEWCQGYREAGGDSKPRGANVPSFEKQDLRFIWNRQPRYLSLAAFSNCE